MDSGSGPVLPLVRSSAYMLPFNTILIKQTPGLWCMHSLRLALECTLLPMVERYTNPKSLQHRIRASARREDTFGEYGEIVLC